MPILATEPNVFPCDLLDRFQPEENFTEATDAAWWVFHTRSRQEKSLARELLQREISFYLPLVRRRLLVRGRPMHSHVPLFTGYVFVRGSSEDRLRALMTNRVAQVLPVKDPEQLRSDLQSIELLIQSGAPLTIESRLEPGRSIRIRGGSLAGLEGTIVRRKNETRLLVWVKMLQQGVSLEIEDYLLEPIDGV